jgi:NAD(P)-dependent dehydrogenase (short-subunit alcohol dehydrogenase family)
MPDLTGTRALITGASDGIGLGIATRLAAAGAEVVLPVRNPRKGADALAHIGQRAPGASASLRELDLSSLASVQALADQLVAEGEPIHLVVNNAGVMTPPDHQLTEDGFELQLGTNHLGHVELVTRLLPLLRASRARVVSQLSIAAARARIDWDDPNSERSYDGNRAYGQSKLALGLFALELGRRSRAGDWGITSVLCHPGVAPTNLLAAQPDMGRAEDTRSVRVIRALSRRGVLVGTPDSAALPALLAATARDDGDGRMFAPKGIGHLGGAPAEQKLFRPLRRPEDATRLWDLSRRLIDRVA